MARLVRARKAGSPRIVVPDRIERAVVLDAVKAWPAKVGAYRRAGTTASLDSFCARRPLQCLRVGAKKRDPRSNKETDEEKRCAALRPLDKKSPIQGGVRCSRFLPGFGSFLDPPASDIGGVPPIGTALVTESCSASHPRDHDSFMAVVGVALGAAWPASLPRDSCRFVARAGETDRRAAGAPSGTEPFAFASCRPTANRPCLRHRIPKKNPKPGKNGNSGRPRVPPCFLSVICFWRK